MNNSKITFNICIVPDILIEFHDYYSNESIKLDYKEIAKISLKEGKTFIEYNLCGTIPKSLYIKESIEEAEKLHEEAKWLYWEALNLNDNKKLVNEITKKFKEQNEQKQNS